MNSKAFIFFGRSGCGKGTQVKLLVDFLKSQKIGGSVDTVQNYLMMLTTAFIFSSCSGLGVLSIPSLKAVGLKVASRYVMCSDIFSIT